MHTQYRLVINGRGDVRRVAMLPQSSPPALAHLSLPVALRVALALLLYILKLRLDSQMLSQGRARQIRTDIMHLMRDLTAADHGAPAETRGPVTQIFAPIVVPAKVSAPMQPVAPRPFIESRTQPVNEPAELPGMNTDGLSQLSLRELYEFARVAARDSKSMFQEALVAGYRKRLVAMFCGPFSVELTNGEVQFPEFRIVCRGAKILLLKRSATAAHPNGEPDSYEMLRQCWLGAKRPQRLEIDGRVNEPRPSASALRN